MLDNAAMLYLLAIYIAVPVVACMALTAKESKEEETINIVPGDKWFKYEDVDLGQPGPTIVTIISLTEDGHVRFKNNSSPVMSLPIEVFLSLFRKLS